MTKASTPAEMSKGQSDNTNNATQKIDYTAVADRLLKKGRSVGITKAIQLVWLTGLRAQPSNSPQQPCNQKDTHLKFVNKPPYIDNKPTTTQSGEVIKSIHIRHI